MKKLLLLILILPFFISCSDDENEDPTQDYTSFVFVNNTDIDMPNSVVGYQVDGLWIKIADLGDLNKNKQSREIILDEYIAEDIYLFNDYISPRKADVAFKLKKNKLNTFKFPSDFRGVRVTDKSDPTQYPQ